MAKANNSEGSFLRDEGVNTTSDKMFPINGSSISRDYYDDSRSLKVRTPKGTSMHSVSSSSSPQLYSTPQQLDLFLDELPASLDDEVQPLTRTSSTSTSTSKSSVAGPQQEQQRRQQQCQKEKPLEIILPNVAAKRREIRNLMGGYGCGTLQQQQLIRTIKSYIGCCRTEYEEVLTSAQKCRRLARTMSQTMNWFHQIITTFEDFKCHFTIEYAHCMVELVAIYVTCELRHAKEVKDKSATANRILQNIYKHLKGSKEEETVSNILRMFTHIPNMYRQREMMTKIFDKLIPKEQVILQQEYPDKLYIQYLIVFYHWKQLELVDEEKLRVVDFANQFMRPAKTLCTNATYAYHLPKYTSLATATRYILNNLKFFHDLRNASIYDNRLKTNNGTIDVSDEDEPTLSKVTVDINFAELVQNTQIPPATRPMVKLEDRTIIATIDLTDEQDNNSDSKLAWLEDLQRNTRKLAPARNALAMFASSSKTSPTANEVIEIDSDSDNEAPPTGELPAARRSTLSLDEAEELDFEEVEYVDTNCQELNDSFSTGSLENSISNTNPNAHNLAPTIKETSALTKLNTNNSAISLPPQPRDAIQSKLNIISVCSIAPNQTNKQTTSRRECTTSTDFVAPSLPPTQLVPVLYTKTYSTSTTQTDNSDLAQPAVANANKQFRYLKSNEIDERTTNSSTTTTTSGVSDCGTQFPPEPNIIDVRSIAATQTTERYDCMLAKCTGAEQFLPVNKPNVLEIRSVERSNVNFKGGGGGSGSLNTISASSSNDIDLTQINPDVLKVIAAERSAAKQLERSKVNASSSTFGDEKYMCRRNSLHINSSPVSNASPTANKNKKSNAQDRDMNSMLVFSSALPKMGTNLPARQSQIREEEEDDDDDDDDNDDDDMMYPVSRVHKNLSSKKNNNDACNGSKVIYSVNKTQMQIRGQEVKDLTSEDEVVNEVEDRKKSGKKKLVKFSNAPVERKSNKPLQYPIKPALKSSTTVFSTSASFRPRFDSESPVSTSSSTCMQTASRKGLSKTIPDEFSRYYSCQEDGLSRSNAMGLPRQTLPDFLKRCVQKPRRSHDAARPIDHSFMASGDIQRLNKKTEDRKLEMDCYVRIETNKELNLRLVAFMNKLLEKQREARRQALERKQREEERQRILSEKLLEEKVLKEQIMELKRQQEEKNRNKANKMRQLEQKKRERRNISQKGRTKKHKDRKASVKLTNDANLAAIVAQDKLGNTDECSSGNNNNSNAYTNTDDLLVPLNSSQKVEVEQQQTTEVAAEATETERLDTSTAAPAASTSNKELLQNAAVNQLEEQPKEIGAAEEEERRLLRASTPERLPEVVTISPRSATRPVKVRIKRAFRTRLIELEASDKNQQEQTQVNKDEAQYETCDEMSKADVTEKVTGEEENSINNELYVPLLAESYYETETPPTVAESTANTATSLTMLANTAASVETLTHARPNDQQQLNSSTTNTPQPPSLPQCAASETAAEAHKPAEDEETVLDNADDNNDADFNNDYLPLIQQKCIYYSPSDSPVNIATAAAASSIGSVEPFSKQSSLTLMSIEATPTVPPYLFNGESRDVNTPTPDPRPISTKPSALGTETSNKLEPADHHHPPSHIATIPPVDLSLTLEERTHAASPITNSSTSPSAVLSTSDHEVSSTQETLCAAMKPRLDDIQNSLSSNAALLSISPSSSSTLQSSSTRVAAILLAAAVQNNQIDTTHHLPESTTRGGGGGSSRATRRRSRKLSTYDEILTGNGDKCKLRTQSPPQKRRKTICGSCASFQEEEDGLSPVTNGDQHTGTSPSTTTNTDAEVPVRKRGRPLTKGTAVPTAAAKKRIFVQTSSSDAILDDPANKQTVNCSSPGVLNVTKNLKHTYLMDNVQNVFVPPEIEKYLDHEHAAESKSSSRAVGKITAKTGGVSTSAAKRDARDRAPPSDKKKILKTVEGAKIKKILDTKKHKTAAVPAAAEKTKSRVTRASSNRPKKL